MRIGPALVAAVLIAGSAILLVRCGGPEAPDPSAGNAPRVPGAVLEFGEISIGRAELDAFDEYFRQLDPTMGKKWRARELLTQHLIPLAFSRVDFAAERATLIQRAQALVDVAQNDIELRARAADYDAALPDKPYDRATLPLPIAKIAFSPENIGGAFGPIETTRGVAVVSLRDIRQGSTTAGDLSDLAIIGFTVHTTEGDYLEWLREMKARAHDTLTWVHPDYRRALPTWLTP